MSDKIVPLYEGTQDDPRPLPLIVAETYNFDLQHYDGDEVLYSILDWIAGIGSSDFFRASGTWRKLQDRLRISNLSVLKYLNIHGKEIESDFTTDENLYRIAQEMRSTKKRPALKSIKEFLASAGVDLDKLRRGDDATTSKYLEQRKAKWLRAGKEKEWIANRNLGIVTRKQLMAIVQQLLGKDSKEIFKTITDDTYIGIFGMPSWKLREHMGIPAGSNVREFMSTLGIIFIAQAEELCRLELEGYADDDIVSPQTVRRVIQTLSELVGDSVKNIQRRTGRDIVTGKKLLPSGDDDIIA